MKTYFVDSGDVKIHVLESGTPSPKRPSLLVICGIWEPAERAIPLLSGAGGHVVALSFRGRGLSSTPKTGYDLEDHLADIEAVVQHCQLKDYVVLGFSRGASYALGWTLQHQDQMSGLILVDQPPLHRKLRAEDVEFWCEMLYQGVPLLNYMRRGAFEGLARDARDVDFAPRLKEIQLPVRFFIGRDSTSEIPSNMTLETFKLYQDHLSNFDSVSFEQSGHMIPDDEPEKYLREIEAFLDERSGASKRP